MVPISIPDAGAGIGGSGESAGGIDDELKPAGRPGREAVGSDSRRRPFRDQIATSARRRRLHPHVNRHGCSRFKSGDGLDIHVGVGAVEQECVGSDLSGCDSYTTARGNDAVRDDRVTVTESEQAIEVERSRCPGDQSIPTRIQADGVSFDCVAGRTRAADRHATARVAGNNISCPSQCAADHIVVRTTSNLDADGVANDAGARRTGADGVAFDDVAGRAAAGD